MATTTSYHKHHHHRQHGKYYNSATMDPRGARAACFGWMEDNQEILCGKQIAWHKEVKEEAFADDDHITVKKYRRK